tara:strand:+ start:694 stop:1551 length:858 start_codon:yes stop_codon:yes gene_type:complete
MMRKKPMLAYPVSDKPIDYNKPVFMQPKLDGVRCLIQAEFTDVKTPFKVKAYSRTGKEWKNIDHILYDLVPFFQKNPNAILDGELYNHDFKDDFESIISMVRKTKPTVEDKLKSVDNVQFHCYDTIMEHMPYHDRALFLMSHLRDSYCVRFLPAFSVDSEERAKLYHQENLGAGYEGSILRTNDVYKCGRSWSLRKFKEFSDSEAKIIGFVEGKGKRIGTIGKFVAVDVDGNEFGMPVMDKFKYLQENFKEMQTWIGKIATFTYFERTKAGSYRHPLFKAIRDYE